MEREREKSDWGNGSFAHVSIQMQTTVDGRLFALQPEYLLSLSSLILHFSFKSKRESLEGECDHTISDWSVWENTHTHTHTHTDTQQTLHSTVGPVQVALTPTLRSFFVLSLSFPVRDTHKAGISFVCTRVCKVSWALATLVLAMLKACLVLCAAVSQSALLSSSLSFFEERATHLWQWAQLVNLCSTALLKMWPVTKALSEFRSILPNSLECV